MADTLHTPVGELYRRVIGYRDDLHLESKWWHRLLKVPYVIVFIIAAIVAGLFVVDARPSARVGNVVVHKTLWQLFDEEKDPTNNLAAQLAAERGTLGLITPSGDIEFLSEYGMESSFCTTNARQAAAEVAAYLNSRNYTTANTSATVVDLIKRNTDLRLCWFASSISSDVDDTSWENIVTYDFTPMAYTEARVDTAFTAVMCLVAAHLVFAVSYHRGFVSIVCGPRRKTTPTAETV
jgi:hypothetical protein